MPPLASAVPQTLLGGPHLFLKDTKHRGKAVEEALLLTPDTEAPPCSGSLAEALFWDQDGAGAGARRQVSALHELRL